MMILDIRTVVFSYVLTDIVCVAVMILLWWQNRRRFTGTLLWVVDFAFQLTALVLIILRGAIPDWASIVLANTLVLTGAWLGYLALLRFAGAGSRQSFNYAVLAATLLIHIYFTYFRPDVGARTFNTSLGLLIIAAQCAWFCLRSAPDAARPFMRGVGLVFAVYTLVSLARIAEYFLASRARTDFFAPSLPDALGMIAYQLLFIALTLALALMYNKRLSEEIRMEEEKFAGAFRSAPYALVLARLSDGKILEINEGFTRITGYDAADVRGKTALDLNLWVNEEDRARVVSDILQTGGIFERKLLFRKKSGDILTGLYSAQLVTVQREACLLSSINDITDREKAAEELRLAHTQWQKTFDATNDSVWVLDRDHRVLRSNRAAERLFNRSAEEMTGRRCWEIAHGTTEPIPECPLLRVSRSLRRESSELPLAGGWYEITVDPILDEAGRYTGAVHNVADIGDRRRAAEAVSRLNQELEEKVALQTRDLRDSQLALLNLVDDLNDSARHLTAANQSLEAVNRELASFSYSVSHDLRSPLRSIDGFSNALLEDYADKLDDQGKDYLARIRRATQTMGNLIDDLLNLSRVSQSDLHLRNFDLSAMVREIVEANQQKNPLTALVLDIQDSVIVHADQRLMSIVMTNLLDNAWKFSGKTDHPRIAFGARVENGETVIFVQDNGAGFNMAYAGKLFSAFSRLHRTDEFPGTGVGLATVARIISRHGGRIWAQAEVGKGATFFFTLP